MGRKPVLEQRRVLVRARGLATFREALCQLAIARGVDATRRRLVLVPSRAAAELLRQTIESRLSPGAATALPDLVTRESWLRRLQEKTFPGRRWLTRMERETVLATAARHVSTRRGIAPPFHLRPGLVSTVLDFYDELRRRERTTRRFAQAIFDELRGERGTDRGSEHLIDQTRFLGFTFLAYERQVAASGAFDEHLLRQRLLDAPAADIGFDEIIVAVADHPADPTGLWPVDFDLAGRLTAVTSLQVVLTDEAHDAGFRERLERQLPGISEARWPDVSREPIVSVPVEPSALLHVSRDREEELRDVARSIRAHAGPSGEPVSGLVGIVFHRPLPYLYLSQQVLADARIPFQTFDALPLAAEPYAALLDLVVTVARTGGTTDASIDLVQSRLLEVTVDGVPLEPRDAAPLEEVLIERRVTGDAMGYLVAVEAAARVGVLRGAGLEGARRAALALQGFAAELSSYRTAPTASAQIRTIETFLRQHERTIVSADEAADRQRRARAAVLSVLIDLALACERHDDRPRPPEAITALIHHAIEKRTFTPRQARAGVHLLDARAARFGEFDRIFLVGLVDSEWSDRPRRSVLYSSGLLRALGWPQDADYLQAQQAAFADMLSLPRVDVRLSAFQLEGDAVVSVSPLVELARRRPPKSATSLPKLPLFPDERLTLGQLPDGMASGQAAWWTWRRARPALTHRDYSGFIAAVAPATYRVSRVDRYVTCPFKYFAENVLQLPEERRGASGLSPLERGTLLHSLFERFYRDWQAQGRGAIELSTLDEALELFADIARKALESLPEPDRALEELRLLGSLVSRGVAERVFELEVASRDRVLHRLLEVDLNGEFSFPVHHGFARRGIAIRGKADRIDVLSDGSLRVIDYKLGRMPDVDRSVQVGVYAYCAQQQLEAEEGRSHPVASAAYLAFGDDRRLEGRISRSGESASAAAEARAQVFAAAVEQIEAGVFPPQPLTTSECLWCGYAGVCRKEYRTGQDEAADTVRD